MSKKAIFSVNSLEDFIPRLEKYTQEEKDLIITAARWAQDLHGDQKRASGEPYFIHPLQVATILVGMQMDYETIIASLLHDILEDTGTSRIEMRKIFGKQVEALVNGVTKISILKAKSKTEQIGRASCRERV